MEFPCLPLEDLADKICQKYEVKINLREFTDERDGFFDNKTKTIVLNDSIWFRPRRLFAFFHRGMEIDEKRFDKSLYPNKVLVKMKNMTNVRNLLQAFLVPKNENEALRFLRDLLTEEEIQEFSRRWEVAQLLADKIPYTQIERKTGMSSTTIARVSKSLKGKLGGYRFAIDQIHHHTRT